MIAFLTLCYVGVLALLVKLNIIRLTLGWKISPFMFFVASLVVLIVPMQWGAPMGVVNVYQAVVEIVPNVTGEVSEIVAKPLDPMKQGEVLFRIDPKLYESELMRLQAGLTEAEQGAKMLPVNLAAAKTGVAQAEVAIVEAKQKSLGLEAALEGAKATMSRFDVQLQLAKTNHSRGEELLKSKAISSEEFQTRQRDLDVALASLKEAVASRDQAQIALESTINGTNTAVVRAEELLRAAQADEAKAQLALDSTIGGENTAVAQFKSQLQTAQLNLDDCTVRAPADGYVVGLALRKGQRVTNLPMRGWMTYVEPDATRVTVAINQYSLRHVRVGQEAEVIFNMYPGRTFSANVESIAYITAAGQVQASGTVPTAPNPQQQRLPYSVILAIDDPDLDPSKLPGGTTGSAAIYTSSATLTHLIRRVELRMRSWMNYIMP